MAILKFNLYIQRPSNSPKQANKTTIVEFAAAYELQVQAQVHRNNTYTEYSI